MTKTLAGSGGSRRSGQRFGAVPCRFRSDRSVSREDRAADRQIIKFHARQTWPFDQNIKLWMSVSGCPCLDVRRIPRIGFAPVHERLHVLQRDEDHLGAEPLRRPAPVMCASARRHGNTFTGPMKWPKAQCLRLCRCGTVRGGSREIPGSAARPRNDEEGAARPRNDEEGAARPRNDEEGAARPRNDEEGAARPRNDEEGAARPRNDEEGAARPRNDEHGGCAGARRKQAVLAVRGRAVVLAVR